MPVSAAPFLSQKVTGFFPATPASVVSGTATANAAAAGNYGMALGNSATVKMQFPIAGIQEPVENSVPYEQYNAILKNSPTRLLKQTAMTVYYTVAGATLTSMTVGIYAVNYPGGAAGTVTTVLAQAVYGLGLPIGTYAVSIPLNKLSTTIPIPYTSVVVELDIATGASGTAVVNGISLS
jgi:hypothetical protein